MTTKTKQFTGMWQSPAKERHLVCLDAGNGLKASPKPPVMPLILSSEDEEGSPDKTEQADSKSNDLPGKDQSAGESPE